MKWLIALLCLCSVALGAYVHVQLPPGARVPALPGDVTIPSMDVSTSDPNAEAITFNGEAVVFAGEAVVYP